MTKNIIILILTICLVYTYFNPREEPLLSSVSLPDYKKDTVRLKVNAACHVFGAEVGEFLSGFPADIEVENYLDSIMKFINLPPHFLLLSSNEEKNACAFIGDFDKERFIIYNKTFLDSVVEKTSTKWSAISIIAHEVAHHLSGHTLKINGSKASSELEADKFSGYILGNLGATLEESTAAMNLFGSDIVTENYPSKKDRIAAIQDGWKNADARKYLTDNNNLENKTIIPDTVFSVISSTEIDTFLRNWIRYQNENIFDKYADLYSIQFQGIRRTLVGATRYCNQTEWLIMRKKTYGQATNLDVSALDVKIINQDFNGTTIQFKQRWSCDLYKDIGDKIMKIYKNNTDHKIYIVYEEMINCYPL